MIILFECQWRADEGRVYLRCEIKKVVDNFREFFESYNRKSEGGIKSVTKFVKSEHLVACQCKFF